MCGIFAAVDINSSFSNEEINFMRKNMNCISYRGPDSEGFSGYSVSNDNDLILGHKRLSIIDLSTVSDQPMETERSVIIFNGEIFNYIEIRNELKSEGIQFRTDSDTEVIIRAYEQRGTSAFAQFNGMWAFVLLDKLNKRIITSRDRFSIKPLYYYKIGHRYYFASEIKQLLPFLQKKEINKEVLHAFINQALLDFNNQTFFKFINKVPARHNFIIDLKADNQYFEEYWNFVPTITIQESDAVEQFRELFYESIKIRLRSDVKTGSLLSGGLDSSAITVVANEISGGNFESFSVVSREKKYSEEHYIDLFTRITNIKNQKVVFEPDMIPQNIDKVLNHQDEPFGSFSVIAQYLIFQKIKQTSDIIVILSGQGGDEALLGYNKYYFFNLINKIKKGKLFEAAKQILGSLIYRTTITDIHWGHAGRYLPGKNKMEYLLTDYDNINIGGRADMASRQIIDFEKFSVPALAHYEDRNSMAFSLEVRHPFLDHHLINFMMGVSDNLKMKNGWSKYLLRKSITEMPEEIRWRRDKRGFVTPDEKWLRKDLKQMIMKSFENSILQEEKIINASKFIDSYVDYAENKKGYFNDIFRVFITELWAKKHFN